MVKGTSQKTANGSALDFKAQLWAAAEQAVPASNCRRTEYNGARPEGLCLGLIIRHITLACSGAVSAPDSNSTAVTDRRYNHRKDVLGRVYEYEKFASAEGTLQSAKSSRSNRRKSDRAQAPPPGKWRG